MPFSSLVFFVIVIIFSAIIHEYSHGWMAYRLGDPTAKYAGRLTLNPLKHLDPFGSVLLPILLAPTGFIFAYAKPVPYNPLNLRDKKWGEIKVAVAGPASNFILAFVIGQILQFMPSSPMDPFLLVIVFANVILGVFNLLPIPPLDGSSFLFTFVPMSPQTRMMLHRYGFVFLLIFIMMFSHILIPVISYLTALFTGGMRLF